MKRWLAINIGRRLFLPVRNQGDVYQVVKLLPDGWLDYAASLIADRQKLKKQEECPHIRRAGYEWSSWCQDCGKHWANFVPSITVYLPGITKVG